MAVDERGGYGDGSVLVGIDPGLLRTGYAFLSLRGDRPALVEAGVVRLGAGRPLGERLAELEAAIEELCEAHGPAVLACEELYAHYKHPRTAILMAHARGVVLALAVRRGMEVMGLAARRVKKVLTGSGRASKAQIQRAVAATLGLAVVPEPNDVADAIAIGLCAANLRLAQRRVTAAGVGGAG